MRQLNHLSKLVFNSFINVEWALPIQNIHGPEESFALLIHHPGSVDTVNNQDVHSNADVDIGSITPIVVQEIEAEQGKDARIIDNRHI